MGKKQYLLTVVLAVVAGFVGGVGSSWVLTGLPVFAQKTPEPAKVIQAEKFEVVDKDGKVHAMFGMEGTGISRPREPVLKLLDKDGGARASLGYSEEYEQMPTGEKKRRGLTYLELHDEEGEGYASLESSSGFTLSDPYTMSSATLDGSILTFSELVKVGDWPLGTQKKLYAWFSPSDIRLSDPDGKSSAELGPSSLKFSEFEKDKKKTRAGLFLYDGEPFLALSDKDEKVRAGLSLSHGEPSLELYDKNGKTRATLGYAKLKNTRTGSEEKRSASSLILFGEDGKVMWEAP